MKTVNKVFLTLIIIGLSLIFIGAIVFGIGYFDARANGKNVFDNPYQSHNYNSESFQNFAPDTVTEATVYDENNEYISNSSKLEIEMEIKASKIYIEKADAFKLESSGFDTDELIVETKGNSIDIRQRGFDFDDSNTIDDDGIHTEIHLYVPENSLEELDLSLGAGTFEMNDFEISKLSIEFGAGTAKLNGISVLDSAELFIGAGSFEAENCSFADTEFKNGAGNLSFNGILNGSNNIESGFGNAEFHLSGNQDDYYVTVKQGLGRVSVNNNWKVGMGDNAFGNDSAPNHIDITSGLGNVTVSIG